MNSTLLTGPCADLNSVVSLPSSKSMTNRALIAAAAAGGGAVHNPLDCEDTRVLAAALDAAGWPIRWGDEIEVGVRAVPSERVRLDLRDSGTGARLILGLLAASPGRCVVDGSSRLRQRPMRPLLETLGEMGASLRSADNENLPVEIDGAILEGGEATVRPEVSSQFVSALLLAAPLMRNGLELLVEGPVPSAPYLELTEEVLRAFGATIERDSDLRRWHVAPEPLLPTRYAVEGDWSAAAFVLAAVAVAGGRVDVGSLDPASRQGDRRVLKVLSDAGVLLESAGDRLLVEGSARLPLEADLRNTPDLFPALAVVGSVVPGGSFFSGLDHLQHKESDRYAAMVDNLQRLGARMTGDRTTLRIQAPIRSDHAQIPEVSAAGDHRIAMAMAVAALAAGPLRLDDRDCVVKSFPGFWKMWDRMIAGERGAGAAL